MLVFARINRRVGVLICLCAGLLGAQPVYAVDPPYQPQMDRLINIMGSLYFLDPLCSGEDRYWRFQAEELIVSDQPEPDRMARLFGSFNEGYLAYSRLYRTCTHSAEVAHETLLLEAEELAREIHTRFAE